MARYETKTDSTKQLNRYDAMGVLLGSSITSTSRVTIFKRVYTWKDGVLVGVRVLKLLVPLFAVILLFRFMYMGEEASISFAAVWEALGSFEASSASILKSVKDISSLGALKTEINGISDFFQVIGNFFKGIWGVIELPVALCVSALEVLLFAFRVLFGGSI